MTPKAANPAWCTDLRRLQPFQTSKYLRSASPDFLNSTSGDFILFFTIVSYHKAPLFQPKGHVEYREKYLDTIPSFFVNFDEIRKIPSIFLLKNTIFTQFNFFRIFLKSMYFNIDNYKGLRYNIVT